MAQVDPPALVRLSEGLGPNAQLWTCFHCGEVCTDAEAARLHFGASEHQQPGCQIDLAEYRRMEEVNRRHCEEDTELHRALHRMECKHQQALQREEETGYAKGLRDGRTESEAARDLLHRMLETPTTQISATWKDAVRQSLALGPND